MNHLVVTEQTLAETVQRIRHVRHQLAQISHLLGAIELDIQQGQMGNLQVLAQRAQQLCEQLSQDVAAPRDGLEARQDASKGTGGEPASRPDAALEPSPTFPDQMGWLMALTHALRSNAEPD